MLKIYFDQCQILKISSIYKEISQFTVHPLEMHTFYLKYHFVRASKGITLSLKKLINTQTLPVQLVGQAFSILMQFRIDSMWTLSFFQHCQIFQLTTSLYLTIFIYLLVSFRHRKTWKETYFHILFGKVTPLKTGKKQIAFGTKTNEWHV